MEELISKVDQKTTKHEVALREGRSDWDDLDTHGHRLGLP